MSDPKHEKQDETFKVVDRRLFTQEGEFRKDIAEQQDREHAAAVTTQNAAQAAATHASSAGAATAAGTGPAGAPAANNLSATPAPEQPKRSTAFENLIRSLGQNAAMLLGGYPDPRTGQAVLDLEGAHEMIDMLDALREKTRGNLSPEEEALLVEMLGSLKLAFMEMNKLPATPAPEKVKSKSRP